MSFGFPAYHVGQVELDVDRQIAREAIMETLDQLGWRYESPHPDSFMAKVPLSGSSWGESFTVSFSEPASLEVRSECSLFPQVFDWGKNKRNVETFLALFAAKANRISKFWPTSERASFDTKESTPLERLLAEEES